MSENTIQRRIRHRETIMLCESFRRMRLSESFRTQLDEGSDVNFSIFLVFVSYVFEANFRKICYSGNQLKHKQQAKIFFKFYLIFYKPPN